jgi:hypothetical protein
MHLTITPQQIQENRAARKAAGLWGCKSEGDTRLTSMRGISWKMDAKGRYGDDKDYDPEDPACFCYDCRESFDPDAVVDLKLIVKGHEGALRAYATLLPDELRPAPTPALNLAKRTPGGGIDTLLPTYSTFEEVPMSLPAPTHRDIMNESPQQRLKGDLATLRYDLHGQLIVCMDKERLAYDGPDKESFLASLREEEKKLWAKLKAVELLLE